MRYLVTGVAGFIGSKVVELLCQNKENIVIGIDNINDYYDIRLKHYRLKQLEKYENYQFQKIDIQDRSAVQALFKKKVFDVVLHLAARAGAPNSIRQPQLYIDANITGTLHLLDAMKEIEVKKMVLASTSSLYAGAEMPFCEDLPVNKPLVPYAVTKKAAELMAYSYHYLYKLDISIVRFFTVFGPAGRPDMCLFRFMKWINEGVPIELFGDGSQSRDFTYIDDAARGFIAASKKVGYEIFNIGGGCKPTELKTAIKYIEKYVKKSAKIEYKPVFVADIKETQADISKAKTILDWNPLVSLEEGIQKMALWYDANRALMSEVKLL